ncbi:transposase [Micromonospora orduensis]|uniref:Transposase n=1 Tax=Micromonospora orduensis TaxID=1420891 RepID=A0A5C4QS83_9ACTN|nr:transposase [Micromonospora orduensis]
MHPVWMHVACRRPRRLRPPAAADAGRRRTAGGRGGTWPVDFSPWQTAYAHFTRLNRRGVTERILTELREQIRVAHGREPEPTAGIIESRSVKGADTVPRHRNGCDSIPATAACGAAGPRKRSRRPRALRKPESQEFWKGRLLRGCGDRSGVSKSQKRILPVLSPEATIVRPSNSAVATQQTFALCPVYWNSSSPPDSAPTPASMTLMTVSNGTNATNLRPERAKVATLAPAGGLRYSFNTLRVATSTIQKSSVSSRKYSDW